MFCFRFLWLFLVPSLLVAGTGNIPFTEFTLPNGLHVIVSENHSAPIVTVDVWYHVGSKNEEKGKTGFAHLFEHMMFQGSANVGKTEHFKYVQEAGGTLNGSTSQDRTNYFETLPANQLALGLWLEADRMRSLAITNENFDNQREVVKEERRLRYDNTPYGTAYEKIIRRVLAQTVYEWTPIGSMEDLNHALLADVKAFHDQYYVPNNATLAVVGDVKPREVRELVEKYFSDIPRKEEIKRPVVTPVPLPQVLRDTVYDNIQLPRVYIAFQGVSGVNNDMYPLEVFADILSSGKSSRLYNSLVYEQRIAQAASCNNGSNESAGMILFSATATQTSTIDEVEKALWNEIKKVATEGVTDREVEKAKNQLTTMLVSQRTTTIARAETLLGASVFEGNAQKANEELGRYQAVTKKDVTRVAAQYLKRNAAVVTTFFPKAWAAGPGKLN